MKKFIPFIACVLLCSCSDAFINHKLTFEKAGACGNDQGGIQMLSNINGERYTFDECMNDSFDGKTYTVTRSGDSIFVKFPKGSGAQSRFTITIDIDAKPAYHHIFFEDREVKVVPAKL